MDNLSNNVDPYTFEKFPKRFAVTIGQQTHNARQLLRAARYSGEIRDMYRQPVEPHISHNILTKTGIVPRESVPPHIQDELVRHGRKMGLTEEEITGQIKYLTRKTITRLRRQAARELRRRQGLAVYDHNPHHQGPPKRQTDGLRRELFQND